jgi:hypothetical protein
MLADARERVPIDWSKQLKFWTYLPAPNITALAVIRNAATGLLLNEIAIRLSS